MPTSLQDLRPIFSDPREINQQADQALIKGLQSQFPIENKNWKLEVSNLYAESKDFSKADQKEAILKSKSLTYPIKGTLTLIDKHSGKVADVEKDFPLMDAFHMTDKHTLLYKGNNYIISNQLQLRPGVYTRSKDTGEIETHFNTGTGRSFSVHLDPQKQLFYIVIDSANILLASLLTDVFGVTNREVESYIPKDLWAKNLEASADKKAKTIKAMYSRMVSTSKQDKNATMEQMCDQLRESLLASKLDTRTTELTLGKAHETINHEAILGALRNLVKVYSGEREEDNRDSLQFKRVQNLPDYLNNRFAKNHQTVGRIKTKLTFNLEKIDLKSPKIRSAIPSKMFSRIYTDYILGSPLVSTPSETNPIESVENVAKVTVLGADEGGIGDERGVPMSARNIDPSHLAIIDPSRTPESSSAGIDQRFTINAYRDREGTLHAKVVDNSGKEVALSVPEMMNHIIGFPGQDGKKLVQAQVRGKLQQVDRSKVEYWIQTPTHMYTITTNLVPFLNSNHPGRLTMAGKAIPQALSLVNREAPLVQTETRTKGVSFVKALGSIVGTTADLGAPGKTATVHRISDKDITLRTENGLKKLPLTKNLPFNMKGFMDDETPLVKEGDTIHHGQLLVDNNYTKNGELALGKNLTVAYAPYKGFNHEDGIVISRSAAESLSSHHLYKVDYTVNTDSLMNRDLLNRYFPGKFTPEQIRLLDDKGFAKEGVVVKKGDPVFAVLEKRTLTPEDRLLARLHKSLVNPYRLVMEPWTHEEPATVTDAHTEGRDVRIILRSVKHLETGDKLTGMHGNKGIVSHILEDHEMPYDEATGKPVDLVLNPASVTSRTNLGQIMETVAGKIAQHTGKPYLISNYSNSSNLAKLKEELHSHGLSDTSTIVDPTTGKKWEKVLTGPQYILKLYKTTDSNYSARSVGGYDNNMQPTKGGEEGSKSIGWMEFLGLLGSDARHNLREIGTVKSENNDTYFWNRFQMGLPLPKPKTTFAMHKFMDYMTACGVKVNTTGGTISARPMTNHEVLSQSSGEIKEPTMIASKNMDPEPGGLFDVVLTGGVKGSNWNHYKLAEPIVNPMFENPVKGILGLSSADYKDLVSGKLHAKHLTGGEYELIDSATGAVVKKINVKN